MKLLRETIRKIILEDKASFVKELTGDPNWDEGARDYYDVPYGDIKKVYRGKERSDRARSRGKNVKKTWAKHVDREFIDSLVYIHWMSASEIIDMSDVLDFLIASEPPNKDELSCSAYINGKIEAGHSMGSIGVIVQGHVSLLGNSMDKMYTGNRSDIDKFHPDMKNTSGVNKGVMSAAADSYVLGKEDFKPPTSKYDENEALLDNWEVIALFCAKDELELAQYIRDEYELQTGTYLHIKHPGDYL